MSSFERDPLFAPRPFRPLAGARVRGSEEFATHGGEAGLAGALGRGLRRGAGEDVGDCGPERHAAIERAAFEKGRESAEADWARCEAACAVFEAAAAAMERASVRMLAERREGMLALAAEIARAWIGGELRLEPTRLASALDRALALCDAAEPARIELHPETLAAFETSAPEFLERVGQEGRVVLAADPRLDRADFRIETGSQSVGGGLGELAARLRAALADVIESTGGESGPC